MKTNKAAATANKSARKGTTKKANAEGAITTKAAKAKVKKAKPERMGTLELLDDKTGALIEVVTAPLAHIRSFTRKAKALKITESELFKRWLMEEVAESITLPDIEAEAKASEKVDRIGRETGVPRVSIHAMCLAAGADAMLHAMDHGPGFKAPFILAQVPELPPADKLPVWIDRRTVELCREIAAAAFIDADGWIEGQIAPHVRDTVIASHRNRDNSQWILEGMGSDLFNGYEFIPVEWEKAHRRIVAIIERERAAEGIPDGVVLSETQVPSETHATLQELAKQMGVPLEDYCSEVICRGIREDREKLQPQGQTSPGDGEVSVTLRFTASEWETLNKKDLLEPPYLGPAKLISGIAEIIACDDGCLPLFIPARIVTRLADAGEAADVNDCYNGLAIEILGEYVSDPQMLREHIESGYTLSASQKRELSKLTSKWKREDKQAAKEKGGQAK